MSRKPTLEDLALQAARGLAYLPLGITPARPVFIVGCARSGTSVLKRVLGRHPDIAALPSEGNTLWHPTLYPWRAGEHLSAPLWKAPEDFTRASFRDWPPGHGARMQRVFGLYQRLLGRAVFLNKSSMINFMLPEVEQIFPRARFIHIVRDGRAVALSYALKEHRKMQARSSAYARAGLLMSFDDLCVRMGEMWGETLAEIDQARASLGWDADERYLECRYEDFCDRPARTAGEIAEYLGLDPDRVRLGEAISDRNHKVREALTPELYERLTETCCDMLRARGYASY